MNIVIASDASGFRLKEAVKCALLAAGHRVADVAQQQEHEAFTYFEAGTLLGQAMQSGAYARGFVFCGSGAGVCMIISGLIGILATVYAIIRSRRAML